MPVWQLRGRGRCVFVAVHSLGVPPGAVYLHLLVDFRGRKQVKSPEQPKSTHVRSMEEEIWRQLVIF